MKPCLHVKVTNTWYLVFQCQNSSCTSLRQYNYCKQESSGSEEDAQPQTTSMLPCPLSATSSDVERDLLEWKQLLEAVLPDKKAPAFRASDGGRSETAMAESPVTPAFLHCFHFKWHWGHLTVLRGIPNHPACRHLLLKHTTNHKSTRVPSLTLSWNSKNTFGAHFCLINLICIELCCLLQLEIRALAKYFFCVELQR